MLRKLFVLGASLLISTLFSHGALSFTLEPVRTVLTLPADLGGQTLRLRNPRRSDLPIVFEIFEINIKDDGSEVTEPADHAFVIFPPQAVVPAEKTQAVRIQWVGGALTQSRSFVLFARELPLSLRDSKSSGVTTVFRMGALIHVTNRGFSSRPELIRYHQEPDGVVVSIGNSGNEFVSFEKIELKFGDEKIGGFDLANVAGQSIIPPGTIRTFKVGGVEGEPELKFDKRR